MNILAVNAPAVRETRRPSEAARERMLSRRGEPLFIAGWRRVLMMHFEVDAGTLQRDVPFQLDLRDGRAFVSLVAFTMEGMRPRFGGNWTARLFKPIATHDFLNMRTYVVANGEPGIHFIAEWLTNRLAVMLGPTTFGLPYRYGRIAYDFNRPCGSLQGRVADADNRMAINFGGNLVEPARFQPAEAGSLTEWLMERYTAFNAAGGRKRFFRVWHPPWPQCPAKMEVQGLNFLARHWPWGEDTRLVGANYSPGFDAVWMARPHKVV
jgi:uncharacterized protein YqjF (DUF2071 family)